jgi:hypothetical protein
MRTERGITRVIPLVALLLAGLGSRLSAEPPRLPAALAMIAAQGDHVVTGNHTVKAGETVEDIVVVGGDLRVEGTVSGDAVVVGGNMLLEAGGSVEGDAIVTGGRFIRHGGTVRGEMRATDEPDGAAAREIRRAVAEGMGAAAAAQAAGASDRVHVRHHDSWWEPIRHGFAGVVQTLALGIVLAGLGAALIFYGRPYLETVSDTVRGSLGRSGAVGLAAGFLVIPAFVVLVLALTVSIVGIPLLLLAVPLYPLAIAAAAALGLLGAAHALGERTAEQRRETFELRYRNSYAYLFTGLGMLLTPLLAANLIEMTGFLRFIGVALTVVTVAVIWAAATVGFGAVILSRAGTRRTFVARPADPAFDSDPFFDAPAGRESPI